MPSAETLKAFIAAVQANDHVGAIERFYTEGASMQENDNPPRVGREKLVENERAALKRMLELRSKCIGPPLVDGDRVVIRWLFEWKRPDGRPARLDEIACQRWEGERIAEEKFFYDPGQMGSG